MNKKAQNICCLLIFILKSGPPGRQPGRAGQCSTLVSARFHCLIKGRENEMEK